MTMQHEITFERFDAAIIAHEKFTPEVIEAVRGHQWSMVEAGVAEMDDAFVMAVEIEVAK